MALIHLWIELEWIGSGFSGDSTDCSEYGWMTVIIAAQFMLFLSKYYLQTVNYPGFTTIKSKSSL